MSKKHLASGATLAAANFSEMIFPFVRNVLLARLIAPDQFGQAITFSIVAAAAEVLTDFGVQYYAVRGDEGGAKARALPTLHAVALVRSAIVGIALAALAPLIARGFNHPEATWAYALLGLGAFLRGLQNLGTKELMRRYVFWPEAATIAGGQIAWTAVTAAFAYIERDYTCMLWGLLASSAIQVAITHLLSPEPWRLDWHGPVIDETVKYGRPLLLNGVANSINSFADRIVIGALLPAAQLALYNVAALTAILPRSVILRFLTGIFLPVFANRTHDSGATAGAIWLAILSLLSFSYSLALVAIGVPVLGAVFGRAYEPSQLFMCLVSVAIFARFMNNIAVPPALASGETRFILGNTLASCTATLIASASLFVYPSLIAFLAILAACECLATAWIVERSIRRFQFPKLMAWTSMLLPTLALTILALLATEIDAIGWLVTTSILAAVGIAYFGLMAAFSYRQGVDRQLVGRLLRRARN